MKKIILSILASLVFLFSFTPAAIVHAQSWYNESPSDWYTKVYDTNNPSEIFGERYTAAQVEWVIYTILFWLPTKVVGPEIMSCALSGNVGSCVQALFSSSNTQPLPVAVSNQSLLSSIFLDERPISAITYFKDLARKFKFIPEAQAQGFGFQYALNPVLDMWKASRNVSYGLLILVTIVLAFMIMFRVKISPQVVISVQSAIPKVVLALILITFSYAMAGFLIDLMYVFIGLVSLVGQGFFPFSVQSTAIFNFLTKGQPWNINVQLGAIGLMGLYLILFGIGIALTLFTGAGAIGTALGVVVAGAGIAALATAASPAALIVAFFVILILLVFYIVLLWMALKTMWILLKAYAMVLIQTIFAPFQILLGVVTPNFGFNSWLKSFVSNLSTFVVVGALFLLSYVFMFQAYRLALQDWLGSGGVERFFRQFFGNVVVNSVTGATNAAWPPLLGFDPTVGAALLLLGASFVIFTMIPKASDIIKAMIEGKPFAYGTAIGEVAAPFKYAAGTPTGRAVLERLGKETVPKVIGTLGNVLPEKLGGTKLRSLASDLQQRGPQP